MDRTEKPQAGPVEARTRVWFRMAKDDEADRAEIAIFDSIGGWFGILASEFRAQFDEIRDAKQITVKLNSPGGDVFDGLAIYNTLREEREKLTVEVQGIAASVASVIALAGRELVMDAGTFLMIHNPYGFAMGDAPTMRKMADTLEKIGGEVAGIYAQHSKLSKRAAALAMAAETWYTADEAVEKGFATSVAGGADAEAKMRMAGFDLRGYAHVPVELQAAHDFNVPTAEPQSAAPAPAKATDHSQAIVAALLKHEQHKAFGRAL